MRFLQRILLVISAFSTLLFSQGFTSLNGTVTDPSGAVIPEASVRILNTQTGQERQTKSDASGRYSFQQVTPGQYKVTASAAGFGDVVVASMELLVNTPSTLELKFENIGTTTQTVSVEADAAAVNTTDASLGNTIGTKPVLQLPFEARNVVGLLSLQPGVTYLGEPEPGATSDYRSGTVNGGKADQGNVTLDGVDVNDQQNRNSFASVLRVTLDSVQEFRTITTNAGAEFGRTSGAQVTLVTKSGTNTVHGSLYEYLRNTATSANSFFNNASGVPRQKLNRNVYGASVGGPIKKNRLFYFLNYEGRQDASEISTVRTVPGDLFRQGIFTYTRKDGSIGQLSPAQITAIDPAHIGPSPAVLAVLQQYPHPNDTTAGDQLNTFGYRFNASAPLRFNTYIAKFDYQIDSAGRHLLFWRGNLQNDKFANTSTTGLQQFPGQAGSQILDTSKGQALGYTWIIQPNLVNNLRYGYTRQGTEITGVQTTALERFRDIDNLTSASTGLISIIPLHQISDDISWTKGAHTVTGGFVTRFIRNNRLNFGNSFSDVLINSSFLLGSGSDLLAADAKSTTIYRRQMANLLGLLTQRTGRYNYDLEGNVLPQGTGIRRNFVNNEYELYAQDAWKLTSNFTVTYGLRVSLSPPISEGNGYQTSPNVSLEDWYNTRGYLADHGQPQSLAPVISYDLASRPGARPLYPYQHDLAPRFAIAYSPDSKSSIRAGFGMFYDLFGQGLIRSADATALGFSTSLTNPANAQSATVPRFTGYTNVDPSILPPAPKGGFPQTQPNIFQITNGVDDKLKAPYTMNINFSYQRDIGHGLLVQGAYVGRLSRRSLIRDDLAMPTNLRDPKSGATYFDAARQLATQINNGVPVSAVQPIPYWENLWPGAAGKGLTATQAIYKVYSNNAPDYTTALDLIDGGDGPCSPSCSIFGRQAIFNGQYSSLAAFRSRGNGNYHGMQLTARKRFSQGLQFDFNYTYSKSIDLSSTRETATSATAGQLINSWFPNLQRAVSDYDIQHNFTAFWVAELPVGKGRHFLTNANRFLDSLVGGWQVSGTFRNTSGFPVGVSNGGVWPTNWEVGSYAIQTGVVPTYHSSKNVATPGGQSGPNLFNDPNAILAAYSSALPGDAGQRNGIRGDGYFGIDLGVGKRFTLFTLKDQPHTLQFRAESFNLTNSVRFDPSTANINILSPNLFGKYVDVLVKPRVFQFLLRYEF
ncbi:MAG: carboxypeptidase regulatory-like domain-containing protein [Acidobacteriaceae bacterium]|nr:carboxypeptidase regulatory-like domain-containing protein [Acidobacteriaceae bacterium]MBV9227231.1 carboxypeptidase regulatory-like domain-containing protein [Acidobacteriaceae bacterium]MBV9307114.1 carboxypeptidase regulatory-like domain-containing protein [Acidobacteriaceae bacterium]MBV9676977.1 carboxypeptidase regulatory-like domain-containing protein [Acidobacteriaceae bacterium]MBV9938157.1 carboxypeptidase regulatory-like domain-containing protein [Acidobacteriaceae bacterium]